MMKSLWWSRHYAAMMEWVWSRYDEVATMEPLLRSLYDRYEVSMMKSLWWSRYVVVSNRVSIIRLCGGCYVAIMHSAVPSNKLADQSSGGEHLERKQEETRLEGDDRYWPLLIGLVIRLLISIDDETTVWFIAIYNLWHYWQDYQATKLTVGQSAVGQANGKEANSRTVSNEAVRIETVRSQQCKAVGGSQQQCN